MKVSKIFWTETAARDLEAIVDFISTERPQTALQVLKKIRLKAGALRISPRRGRLLPELAHLKGLPFRELVEPPWRIIYRIHANAVQILSVLDGRRDLEDLLYDRLTAAAPG